MPSGQGSPGPGVTRYCVICRPRQRFSKLMTASDRSRHFVEACIEAIGAAHVLTDAHDTAPFLTDWRKRYHGQTCAVLLPGTTEQVAKAVQLAREFRVPIVPQGGNTGHSGGATPDASGTQGVISLRRLNPIRDVDPLNNPITGAAGAILAGIQARAEHAQRLFALSP